jgi:hypothetical protein
MDYVVIIAIMTAVIIEFAWVMLNMLLKINGILKKNKDKEMEKVNLQRENAFYSRMRLGKAHKTNKVLPFGTMTTHKLQRLKTKKTFQQGTTFNTYDIPARNVSPSIPYTVNLQGSANELEIESVLNSPSKF